MLLACVLTGALGLGQCPPPDGPVLRVLVVSGDPAPGLDGVTLAPIDAQWSARSDVGFMSHLYGPGADEVRTQAVWVPGRRGTPRFVIAANDPLPGIGPEAIYGGSLAQLYLGPRGDAILSLPFRSAGLGTGLRVYGVVDREGGFEPLVWDLGPIPGLPGLAFQRLGFAIQSGVNRFGEFAFIDDVDGPDVDETNDHVLMGPLGEDRLAVIACDGDPAPTEAPDAVFLDLDTRFHGAPKVDDLRRVSFHANWGPPDGPERDGLFQSHPDGTIEALFLPGDDAPGTEPSVVFGRFGIAPVVSPAGALAFKGQLALGPDVSVNEADGIWVVEVPPRMPPWSQVRPGSPDPPRMRLAFREGDTPPGVSEDFYAFSIFPPYSVNDRGEVALTVDTANGVDSKWVVFRDGWEDREPIATEDDPMPGMPGTRIGIVGVNPTVNAHGDVWFGGTLLDDATGEDLGFFTAIAPVEGGGFLPVRIAAGSLIELAPGDAREVRGALVHLNDRRELLYEVVFTDNTRALLCTDVPRGSPLRFHPSRCGRWWSGAPRYAASPLDDLVGEVP
jgi:hypothetical protein